MKTYQYQDASASIKWTTQMEVNVQHSARLGGGGDAPAHQLTGILDKQAAILRHFNAPDKAGQPYTIDDFSKLFANINQVPQKQRLIEAIGEYKAHLLSCQVSCDYVPRRSMPLFRAKAMLDELIAGFPKRSPAHRSSAQERPTA